MGYTTKFIIMEHELGHSASTADYVPYEFFADEENHKGKVEITNLNYFCNVFGESKTKLVTSKEANEFYLSLLAKGYKVTKLRVD